MTDAEPAVDRRTFLKTTTAGAGAVTVGAGAGPSTLSPTQEAQAAPWLVPAAAGAIVGMGVGAWLHGDDGSEPDAEEVAENALKREHWVDTYDYARVMRNYNMRYIGVQPELLDGLRGLLFEEGVTAATAELNQEESLEVVKQAAQDAKNNHVASVESELLDKWEWNMDSLYHRYEWVEDDIGSNEIRDIIRGYELDTDSYDYFEYGLALEGRDVQRSDGTVQTVNVITQNPNYGSRSWATPAEKRTDDEHYRFAISNPRYGFSNDPVTESPLPTSNRYAPLLDFAAWNQVWEEIQTISTEVGDELDYWCENAYADIQSGDLDPDDLMTASRLRTRLTEEEDFPMAVADLVSLGVDVPLDRSVTIRFTDDDTAITWELQGLIAALNAPGDALVVGETYDPDALGAVYLNFRPSLAVGDFDGYDEMIDGGEVVFDVEPYAGLEYLLQTNHGETVSLYAEDFDPNDPENPTKWTTDISGDVETSIGEVESVVVTYPDAVDSWEQISVPTEFTVLEIYDENQGTTVDSVEFSELWDYETDDWLDTEHVQEMSDLRAQLYDDLVEDIEGVIDESSGGGTSGSDIWSDITGVFGSTMNTLVAVGAFLLLIVTLGAVNAAGHTDDLRNPDDNEGDRGGDGQ